MTDAETRPLTAMVDASPRTFVRVEGLPFEDGPSTWHVNDHPVIGSEGAAEMSHALVLQRGDASDEWLAVVIEGDGTEWGVEMLTRSRGADAMRTDDGEPVDPDGVRVTLDVER